MHESKTQFRNTLKVTVTMEKKVNSDGVDGDNSVNVNAAAENGDGDDDGVGGRTNGGRE